MDSDRSFDISNLEALIGLRQQEKHRLRSMISDVGTAPEVRSQAQTKLAEVLRDIRADAEELAKLEVR